MRGRGNSHGGLTQLCTRTGNGIVAGAAAARVHTSIAPGAFSSHSVIRSLNGAALSTALTRASPHDHAALIILPCICNNFATQKATPPPPLQVSLNSDGTIYTHQMIASFIISL